MAKRNTLGQFTNLSLDELIQQAEERYLNLIDKGFNLIPFEDIISDVTDPRDLTTRKLKQKKYQVTEEYVEDEPDFDDTSYSDFDYNDYEESDYYDYDTDETEYDFSYDTGYQEDFNMSVLDEILDSLNTMINKKYIKSLVNAINRKINAFGKSVVANYFFEHQEQFRELTNILIHESEGSPRYHDAYVEMLSLIEDGIMELREIEQLQNEETYVDESGQVWMNVNSFDNEEDFPF